MSMQRNKAISAIKASARWRMATDAALHGVLLTPAPSEPLDQSNAYRQQSGQYVRISHTGEPMVREEPYEGLSGVKKDIAVLRDMVLGSYINILLCAIPASFLSHFLTWGAVPTFVLSFLSLIPLALILGDITEDLALRFGDVIGGLLNATFGNVVEVILSIAALQKGLYTVVAASLIGSILSNLLLVLGFCMLLGGAYYKTQTFNAIGNRACSSLLFLAVIGIVTPTAASLLVHDHGEDTDPDEWILKISRISAIILLVVYACYLSFQLGTHKDIFDVAPEDGDEGHVEEPQLSFGAAMLMLGIITVFVSCTSEFLTGSIEEVSSSTGLGEAFLGMIVLPIAGNACEHITAVVVAMKDKMDLALGVAMGSSLQIALFALPLCVVVGWATGHPFSLNMDPFMALVLTFSVMHGTIITNDASSHWLLGVQLIAVYSIVACTYFYR